MVEMSEREEEALRRQLEMPLDPANAAPYPRGFALDLALDSGTLPEILASHDLTAADAKKIFANPSFRAEYEALQDAIQEEGYSFRLKAQAQAEAHLGLVWRLANSETVPAAVRADLIKSVVKWSGLDNPNPPRPGNLNTIPQEALDQLKSLPDGELEVRVLQIISRRTPAQPPAPQEGRLIEGEIGNA